MSSPNTDDLLCFENTEELRFFKALYPRWRGALDSFDSWVFGLTGEKSPDPNERETEFVELLPRQSAGFAKSLLYTIEKLRESLVLSHEDVDFCFSELPSTVKNRALKELFHRYLDSNLSRDRTAYTWALIERIKAGGMPDLGRITFVRSRTPSFIFEEFAKTHSFIKTPAKVHIVNLWELFPDSRALAPVPVMVGSETKCLQRLAERLHHLVHRGISPRNIFVPFHGKSHLLSFLQYTLDHYGIPYASLIEEQVQKEAPSPLSCLIENLRHDHTRPLKDRLRLGSILLQSLVGKPTRISLDDHFTALVKAHTLSSEESAYLNLLMGVTHSPSPRSPPSEAVRMVPFIPLPVTRGTYVLPFCDATLLDSWHSPLLFEEEECGILRFHGFPIFSKSDRKRTQQNILAMLGKRPYSHVLFTSLPCKMFQGRTFRLRSLLINHEENETPETIGTPETHVALPPQPFSATGLENYARCPSTYFFSNRLKLRKMASHWESEHPLYFGQAVHRALEQYFKKHSELSMEAEIELPRLFSDALKELVQWTNFDTGSEPTMWVVLTEDFARLVPRITKLENQLHALFGGSKAVALEKPFLFELDGIQLRGTIDRIDECGDYSLVLDYKTGTVDFSPGHIGRGDFQALLYLLAVETLMPKPSIGLLFYDLKTSEIRRGVLREDHVQKEVKASVTRGHVLNEADFAELKRKGIESVKLVAHGIFAGNFQSTPTPDGCRFCDFGSFCREKIGYV